MIITLFLIPKYPLLKPSSVHFHYIMPRINEKTMTGFYVYSNLNPLKLNLPRFNYLKGNFIQRKCIYKVLFKTKLYILTLLPKYSSIQKLVHSDKKRKQYFCDYLYFPLRLAIMATLASIKLRKEPQHAKKTVIQNQYFFLFSITA